MNRQAELIEKIGTLHNMLVSCATGGGADKEEYEVLRAEPISEPSLEQLMPRFLWTGRSPLRALRHVPLARSASAAGGFWIMTGRQLTIQDLWATAGFTPSPGLHPGFATLAPLRRVRACGTTRLGGAAYLAPRYPAIRI